MRCSNKVYQHKVIVTLKNTAKNDFFKDLFNKYDQIRRFLQIWSQLLKKSLLKNVIFCSGIYAIKG